MKYISWNVNGLRACMGKGFTEFFNDSDADVFCVQETKLQEGQIDFQPEGYSSYWNYAVKKGYSGTVIFTKSKPISVRFGMEEFFPDEEGRLITLEFKDYFLVTIYTPNSQRGLARLNYRLEWEGAFRAYLHNLDGVKAVIVCGDLNVAHKEIHLKNPKSNHGNAGFSDEERAAFSEQLANGFTDTYRYLYPDRKEVYSWWSYMYNARANNAGWRIDYFLASDRLAPKIIEAEIFAEITGSDHCPVGLIMDINE